MNLKKEDIMQAFFAAGLEGDYNFLEHDLLKLANDQAGIIEEELLVEEDEEIKEKVFRAVKDENTRCIMFVHSLNPEVAKALEAKKGPL